MTGIAATDTERGGDRHLRFFQLYTRNQSLIYSYILAFVPRFHEADDIFQDVSTAMWEHFDKYQPGTDFLAWGRTIAHHRVIDYVRRCQRDRVCYSSDTMQVLSDYVSQHNDQQDQRIRALESCLAKLSENDRFLVKARYSKKTTTKDLAERVGRSVNGLYKTMARIHCLLYDCIQRTLVTETRQ